MRTRTSERWETKPGKFDIHNSYKLFESDNYWEIPMLVDKFPQNIPEVFLPFNYKITSNKQLSGRGIHFFLDDYRFESIWTYPDRCLDKLRSADVVLGPDFSLWLDFPYILQAYNTYRNMWCCRYWQENGVKLVPTASWSDRKSFEFCFCGIPKKSPVAISTVGVNKDNIEYFMTGFEELLKIIEPNYIIVYGKQLEALQHKNLIYIQSVNGLRNIK